MKRPAFLLAMLACGASLLQAADLYDITLTNAQKYTSCRISYTSGGKTKFTGKDKSGKTVTMTVKTSSILSKKEVEEEVKPAPVAEEPTPAPAPEPTAENKPAAEGEAAPAEQPAAADDQKPAEAPKTEATPAPEEDVKAKDISLELRKKMEKVNSELASLTKPSNSLVSAVERGKSSFERNIGKIDEMAIEVAELQTKFNQVTGGDYTFTHVTSDARDKYMRDGKAAHDAMVIDVKEHKNSRKVGGLDKFEILRERYQGIPEYKEAYNWYITTLKTLQKRWTNLLNAEEKKRSKLNSAKQADMREKDEQAYKRLEDYFEKEGEQIAKVWYNPEKRNLVMLKAATSKVKDALRRNENGLRDEAIGTVPAMIEGFWANMDKVRTQMISGDLAGAGDTLKADENYNKLLRLNRQLLPEDYKAPLRAQRQDLDQEIKRRIRERTQLEKRLEQKIGQLERATESAEAQLDSLLERIALEKEVDTQDSSVELDEKKPAPAKPAAPEQPKEPENKADKK